MEEVQPNHSQVLEITLNDAFFSRCGLQCQLRTKSRLFFVFFAFNFLVKMSLAIYFSKQSFWAHPLKVWCKHLSVLSWMFAIAFAQFISVNVILISVIILSHMEKSTFTKTLTAFPLCLVYIILQFNGCIFPE